MTQPDAFVTLEAYLDAEVEGQTRHEWLDGVVYEIGDSTLEHSRLGVRIGAALRAALPRCEVHGCSAMIRVPANRLCTYADFSVISGPISVERFEQAGRFLGEALLDPTVIGEVLSPSTEAYDRGEKFSHYMRIPSLEAYVLAQDRPRIEVFRRPKRGHREREEATAAPSRDMAPSSR